MVAVACGVLALCASAKTGYWTGGGTSGAWTDATNWKDGIIPGRLGSPGDDAATASGDFGDTAVFSSVEDGAQTVLDLSGLRSIGHIVIRGASAPSFTFGSAAGGYAAASPQNLRLEPLASFTLEADVVHAPTFASGVSIADGFDVGDVSGVSVVTNTFRNESSVVLDLPAFAGITALANGSLPKPVLDFRGAGDIRLNGQFVNNFEILLLNQTGRLIVNTILRSRESGHFAPYGIEAGTETAVARIQINADCELTPSLQYQNYIKAENADLEITGAGIFGSHFDGNNTQWMVAQGRTLTLDCLFKSYKSQEATVAAGFKPIIGIGTLRFLHAANEIPGPLQIATACTVEAASIGNADTASALGSGSVAFGNWGSVKYTRPGKTTGNKLSIIKFGTGRWVFSGANTYTGTTTLRGGVLRYATDQTIAALTVQGTAALEVADGVTVMVAAFSHASGTLDIVTEGDMAQVKIAALAGQSPAYVTWNGAAAKVDADGGVTIDADATVAAPRVRPAPDVCEIASKNHQNRSIPSESKADGFLLL